MADSGSEDHDISSEESSNETAAPISAPITASTSVPLNAAMAAQQTASSSSSLPLPMASNAATLNTDGVIVANNPLPQSDFPPNAPRTRDTHLNIPTKPILLNSAQELEKIMAESREQYGFSNFEDLATPNNSARVPVFPTFTRFSSTRFANAEQSEYKVIETDRPETGAIYDMAYPINLTITDHRGISLPDLPHEGIPDSKGYPLMYSSELPRKSIKARSSAALYQVNMSRTLASKLSTYPDQLTIKTWAHMFQLTGEKDAQAILMNRAMGSQAGDNHIALLLKAYLAYFDSTAGSLEGIVPGRNSFSSAGIVINVSQHDNWTSQVLASQTEIVNVLGGSSAYQEFWAYCCFDQPPVFAAKTSPEGVMTTTAFSHYKLDPGLAMTCICDTDAYNVQRKPVFFGQPNLILGYIETYVQKFGLQEQANEALQIAMLWPSLIQMEANISMPKPLHTADWLGAEVERSTTQTAYQGLVASSPFVALASTLASAWALQSQIYDYVTLLSAQRNTWELPKEVVRATMTWLITNVSAPGVGWDFLFRHQFNITPSFLYLTGLSVETVDWQHLLSRFTWRENQFPAHLRLIQPFWVNSSVCCRLPWEQAWKPEIDVSGPLLTATPATIMRMLRLSLLDGTAEGIERATSGDAIFPILEREGRETIELGRCSVTQLQTVVEHGVKVLALCARTRAPTPQSIFSLTDPVDSSNARKLWSFGTSGKSRSSRKS